MIKQLNVIDERLLKNCSLVLIQNEKNEIRAVKLSEKNQTKFNLNLLNDINLLWNLYETNPAEFQINN